MYYGITIQNGAEFTLYALAENGYGYRANAGGGRFTVDATSTIISKGGNRAGHMSTTLIPNQVMLGSTEYDGTEKAIVVDTGKLGMGTVTVKYYRDGALATPKDVGTYTAKIDVAMGTAYSGMISIFAERFNRGVGGSKLTTPLAEKLLKHKKRAIKYHSQNPWIMRKTLEIKGFSLYQPFGWVMVAEAGFEPTTFGL